jgi:uracil-DNA glycosylase
VHGKKYDVAVDGRQTAVIPMYHPAASLRNGKILELEKLDFEKLKDMLQSI